MASITLPRRIELQIIKGKLSAKSCLIPWTNIIGSITHISINNIQTFSYHCHFSMDIIVWVVLVHHFNASIHLTSSSLHGIQWNDTEIPSSLWLLQCIMPAAATETRKGIWASFQILGNYLKKVIHKSKVLTFAYLLLLHAYCHVSVWYGLKTGRRRLIQRYRINKT